MPYYVYIISNRDCRVLYTGVTNDLVVRINQHKAGEGSKFAFKYNCKELLYYEIYQDVNEAIAREKQLKRWPRQWKEELIIKFNPQKKDLIGDFT